MPENWCFLKNKFTREMTVIQFTTLNNSWLEKVGKITQMDKVHSLTNISKLEFSVWFI